MHALRSTLVFPVLAGGAHYQVLRMTKQLIAGVALSMALALTGSQAWAQASEDKPATTLAVNPAANGPLKIGYTSVYYILSISPKAKEIESDLKARNAQLEKELQRKMSDFEEKYTSFQRGQQTMSETIKADKYRELQNLEASIKEFQKNAEQEMAAKREELVSPELEKISKGIKDVARENQYTYILNGDPQIMIYGVDEHDITDLVLKKLGIPKPAPGSATDVKPAAKPAGGGEPARPSSFPKAGKKPSLK